MIANLVSNYTKTNYVFHKVFSIVQPNYKTPKIDHAAVRFLRPNCRLTRHFNIQLQPEIYKFPSFKASARWYKLRDNVLNRLFVTTYDNNFFPDIITYDDYQNISKENPFLAWTTLFSGHINHIALEVPDIKVATENCIKNGIEMNTSNGLYKVSKDGLLIQSATIAIPIHYSFLNETTERVPRPHSRVAERVPYTFVELVERRKDSNGLLREGFEQENALHIFDSTKKMMKQA